MLRKKFIIPMVAIMSVASSGSVFASEKAVDDNKVIYREAEVTAKSGLNVRETPAIEKDNKIFAVPIGTELDIIDKENDWFKVKLDNNKEAYINSNYVKVNHNDLYVNVDRLNFREAPGTDKKIYDVLTKGTKIQFLEESGDWVKVKVNNTTGYVHSNYINNEKPVVEESSKADTTTTSKKEENTTSTVKPSKDVEDKADKNESKKEQANESKTEVSKKESTNKEESKKPSVQKEESKETSKKEESTSSQSKPSTSKPSTSKPSTSKPSTSKPSESKPSTSKPAEDTNKEESEKPSSNKNVQAVIDLAYAQIGKPYNWGSEGPSSFDCSGLMRYIFQNGAGVNLPRTSKAQSQYGTTVSRSNLKPGDLIFSSTDGSGTVSHVGIYIGGGQMIHAPKPGDVVKVSSINSSYWNDVYLWAKRVM